MHHELMAATGTKARPTDFSWFRLFSWNRYISGPTFKKTEYTAIPHGGYGGDRIHGFDAV